MQGIGLLSKLGLGLILCLSFNAAPLAAQAKGDQGRLIVLGFDGIDYARCQKLMAAGKLPNLSKLAKVGSFKKLEATNPAISPVSWSSLTTGVNPGKTGIDGFLRRDFSHGDVRVRMSMVERRMDNSGLNSRSNRRLVLMIALAGAFALFILAWFKKSLKGRILATLMAVVFGLLVFVSESWLPDGRPFPHNLRQGKAYWEELDEAGVSSTTILAPCAFPAPDLEHGHLLCGLGVPDALGTPGFWTVYRDDETKERTTETGGFIKPLIYRNAALGEGQIEPIFIEGPPNILRNDGSVVRAPFALNLSREDGIVYLTNGLINAQLADQTWSDDLPILYPMGPFARVRGHTRFKVLNMDDGLTIYQDPVSLDPRELPPGVKLSHPELFGAELWAEVGSYETTGWACATNALRDGTIDAHTFLEDCRRVWTEQEALALAGLAKPNQKVVTTIFTVPDRIQHMFSRFDWTDRDLDGRKTDPRFATTIDRAYERMDVFVGKVMAEHMEDGDRIMVVSDHGFSPWKRAVNLNRWLIEQGLLVLKDKPEQRKLDAELRAGVPLDEIDWQQTQAYSMGLGRIYLNLKGREPQGIVDEVSAQALRQSIPEALMQLKDDDGSPVVSKVSLGDKIYLGDAIPEGRADFYIGFHRGYRVSWQTCLGGSDEAVLSDNNSAWSGDHCSVDPTLVPGVIYSNFKLAEGPARVVDVGPTVLDIQGVKNSQGGSPLDGHSLLAK